MGFSGDTVVKNLPTMQETQEMQIRSLGQPVSPAWQANSLPPSHLRRPIFYYKMGNVLIVPCAVW